MWIQKNKLTEKISWNEVLDWVLIDGVIRVEIQEKEVRDVCIVRC